ARSGVLYSYKVLLLCFSSFPIKSRYQPGSISSAGVSFTARLLCMDHALPICFLSIFWFALIICDQPIHVSAEDFVAKRNPPFFAKGLPYVFDTPSGSDHLPYFSNTGQESRAIFLSPPWYFPGGSFSQNISQLSHLRHPLKANSEKVSPKKQLRFLRG